MYKRIWLISSVTGMALFASFWYWRSRKKYCKVKVVPSSVHLVTTCSEWNAIYPTLHRDIAICKVLGFDCEWVSLREGGSRPVALLQLATPSGVCVLVRLLEMDDIPITLVDLLADKTVLKMGVGCLGDARKLMKDHALLVRGCVDLRHLATRSRLQVTGLGLKALTEAVLGVDLEKNILIRASNWELSTLTPQQIQYAAMDALVGVKIFLVLLNRKIGIPTTKQLQPIADPSLWAKALSMCQGIIDTPFSNPSSRRPRSLPNNAGSSDSTKEKPQTSRAYSYRRRPLYNNCQLQAADGQLLCTCSIKKAEWYLDKGLGTKISSDPLVVQLNFEPSGRPSDDKNYYLHDKFNVCVVCGKEHSYIRKNVVPQEYRKHFPFMLKEHRSHDVLLMCSFCHQRSTLCDNAIKERLAAECHAPLGSGHGAKYTTDHSLQQVKSAAKALLNILYNKAAIPDKRKEELSNVVKLYYGADSLSETLLLEASNMDIKLPNSAYVAHGKRVVQHMVENGGLMAFERMWRQNLLDTMKPEHLPAMWSVDHGHDELVDIDENMKSVIT